MKRQTVKSPKFGIMHTLIAVLVWISALIILINPDAKTELLSLEQEIFLYPLFFVVIGTGFLIQSFYTYDFCELPKIVKLLFYIALLICFLTVFLNLRFKSLLWFIPYAASAALLVAVLCFILKVRIRKEISVRIIEFLRSKPVNGKLFISIVAGQIFELILIFILGEIGVRITSCLYRTLVFLPLIIAQNVFVAVVCRAFKIPYGKKYIAAKILQSVAVLGLIYAANLAFYAEVYHVMRMLALALVCCCNLVYAIMELYYRFIEKNCTAN